MTRSYTPNDLALTDKARTCKSEKGSWHLEQAGSEPLSRCQVCEDSPDQYMPSANTCFHFLKLPEYSSEKLLESQLKVRLAMSL